MTRTLSALAAAVAGATLVLTAGCVPMPTDTGTEAEPASQASSKPAAKKVDKTAPKKSSVTKGQEQALKKAQSYLDVSAFSKKGLAKQLKFEGFSGKEADYAVDNVGADWKEQAAKKAQEYLDATSFSRSGLIKQLKFEGFTEAQADHGADAVGL
jgi:SOS response regulatory protein OraA/RecX